MLCLVCQDNINKVAKDEDTEIKEVMTKDEETNPESTEIIQEESIMEDTENMQIEAVVTEDGDIIPESTKASFLSTYHYYSNSDVTDQFLIF